MTHDPVNRPSHYAEGRQYEPISVIEDWQLGYHLGNALKYISRAGRKSDRLEDLKKARWYLDREISKAEGSLETENDSITFLTEGLYSEVCSADECGNLWDPALGPIEPPEECFHAAQPVHLPGGAGEDVLSFALYDNPYS